MAFMIDTNIAIHARDGVEVVLGKLEKHSGDVVMSALSLAEMQRRLRSDAADAAIRRERLEELLKNLPILAFDAEAAKAYGGILALREWVRARDFDRMIAGHALSCDAVLVTNNEADFRDIPGLKLENWLVGG